MIINLKSGVINLIMKLIYWLALRVFELFHHYFIIKLPK